MLNSTSSVARNNWVVLVASYLLIVPSYLHAIHYLEAMMGLFCLFWQEKAYSLWGEKSLCLKMFQKRAFSKIFRKLKFFKLIGDKIVEKLSVVLLYAHKSSMEKLEMLDILQIWQLWLQELLNLGASHRPRIFFNFLQAKASTWSKFLKYFSLYISNRILCIRRKLILLCHTLNKLD